MANDLGQDPMRKVSSTLSNMSSTNLMLFLVLLQEGYSYERQRLIYFSTD
jgi:hypothetical protein